MFSRRESLVDRKTKALKNLSNVRVYLSQYYNDIQAIYCAKDVDLTSKNVTDQLMKLYEDGPYVNVKEKSEIIKVDEEQFISDLNLCIGGSFKVEAHVVMGHFRPMISFNADAEEREEMARSLTQIGTFTMSSAAEQQEKFQSKFKTLPSLLRSLGIETIIDEDLQDYLGNDNIYLSQNTMEEEQYDSSSDNCLMQ